MLTCADICCHILRKQKVTYANIVLTKTETKTETIGYFLFACVTFCLRNIWQHTSTYVSIHQLLHVCVICYFLELHVLYVTFCLRFCWRKPFWTYHINDLRAHAATACTRYYWGHTSIWGLKLVYEALSIASTTWELIQHCINDLRAHAATACTRYYWGQTSIWGLELEYEAFSIVSTTWELMLRQHAPDTCVFSLDYCPWLSVFSECTQCIE